MRAVWRECYHQNDDRLLLNFSTIVLLTFAAKRWICESMHVAIPSGLSLGKLWKGVGRLLDDRSVKLLGRKVM